MYTLNLRPLDKFVGDKVYQDIMIVIMEFPDKSVVF